MKPTIRRGGFCRWTVYEPDGTATQFRTHAQAVAHADEVARTITVTLPPFEFFMRVGDLGLSEVYTGTLMTNQVNGEQIWIEREVMAPLALALLATAHYRERNQK